MNDLRNMFESVESHRDSSSGSVGSNHVKDDFGNFLEISKDITNDKRSVNNKIISLVGFRGLFDRTTLISTCINDTQRLVNSAIVGEKWTIPFIDASGKPGPSVTKGWLNFVGNYDQCKNAVAPPIALEERRGFNGEYCVLKFSSSNLFVTPKIGICLPDTCSVTDITLFASKIVKQFQLNLTLGSVECLDAKTEVTSTTVITIIILTVLGILIVAGTSYDALYIQKWSWFNEKYSVSSDISSAEASLVKHPSLPNNYESISNNSDISRSESEKINPFAKIILPFSAYTNALKILTVSHSSESLTSVHGIRYLSICWVVLGHTYLFGIDYSINKSSELAIYFRRWTFSFIANSLLSVDTFFVLSGLLTSYLTVTEMAKTSWKINWPLFYFHRFWRLTPSYMIVLLISLGLTQYMGEGPLWGNQQPTDKNVCEDNWWKNLLYINNFDKVNKQCMPHSWYLPNDMQFYVVSPLLLIPLHIHRVGGIMICGVLLLASWVFTGVSSSVNDWTPTYISVDITPQKLNEYLNDYYMKPWCRIAPFIIGILTGYLLATIKGKSIKIKWWVVALGWVVAIGSSLSVVYGLHGDISGEHTSSTNVSALYNSIARSVWGAAVCWVIVACHTSYGGPINAFLSWSPFVVLGRLTYMTYLVHPYIMKIFFQNMGSLFYMSSMVMAVYFIAFLVFSNFVAFIFMLCIESPMMRLEKLFIPEKTKIELSQRN